MKYYYYSEDDNTPELPQKKKLSLGERAGNFVSRKIARWAPKHIENIATAANKDTHKANYQHEVFGGLHRALDVHKKKRSLKKLYKMLDRKEISGVNQKFQGLTHGMSIPQLKAAKRGLMEAYRKAGKNDD